jgi:hypothetical protein
LRRDFKEKEKSTRKREKEKKRKREKEKKRKREKEKKRKIQKRERYKKEKEYLGQDLCRFDQDQLREVQEHCKQVPQGTRAPENASFLQKNILIMPRNRINTSFSMPYFFSFFFSFFFFTSPHTTKLGQQKRNKTRQPQILFKQPTTGPKRVIVKVTRLQLGFYYHKRTN